MKKIVIYWSGTGNTEVIANLIAADVSAECKKVDEISVDEALGYETIILGCPAMGAEELEEMEFKPFYDAFISQVNSQKIYLFGSYDWGDGEWMRLWQDDVNSFGANLGKQARILGY